VFEQHPQIVWFLHRMALNMIIIYAISSDYILVYYSSRILWDCRNWTVHLPPPPPGVGNKVFIEVSGGTLHPIPARRTDVPQGDIEMPSTPQQDSPPANQKLNMKDRGRAPGRIPKPQRPAPHPPKGVIQVSSPRWKTIFIVSVFTMYYVGRILIHS
jgi:hypothetical protein